MGYTTEFEGKITFNKPISPELKEYINKFSYARHMKRDNEKIKEVFPNWEELCYNGTLGEEGEYFIGGLGFCGQDKDDSIIDYNYPPHTQDGLWCKWIINDNGELVWNEAEKFYGYVEWLRYLINNFLAPNGYIANGRINYQGEEPWDGGYIKVVNNKVTKIPTKLNREYIFN